MCIRDRVETGVFRGCYLYYVSTLLGPPALNCHLFLEKIGILTEDIHPDFVDSLVVEAVKEVQLPVGLAFRGHIPF